MADSEMRATRILDRDLSEQITREARVVGGPALRLLVDEGIRAFDRCSATATGHDENTGFLFPFLHIFECLDAVEVLLEAGATKPAGLQLRASLEGLLGIEWIARDGASLRYGAAYVVADVRSRMREIEQFTAGSPERKQLVARLKKSDAGRALTVPARTDLDDLAGWQRMLAQPHLAEADAEFLRLKQAARGKAPPFYALWGGPQSLADLADLLGRTGEYEFLYREWSRTMHGSNLRRQLGATETGEPGVAPFRSGEGIKNAYSFALNFGVDAIETALRLYRPDELTQSFARFVATEILPVTRRLV